MHSSGKLINVISDLYISFFVVNLQFFIMLPQSIVQLLFAFSMLWSTSAVTATRKSQMSYRYINQEFHDELLRIQPSIVTKTYKIKPVHMPKSIDDQLQSIDTEPVLLAPSTLALHHLIPKHYILDQLSKEISSGMYTLKDLLKIASCLELTDDKIGFTDTADRVQEFVRSIVWAPMFLVLGPEPESRENDPKDGFDEALATANEMRILRDRQVTILEKLQKMRVEPPLLVGWEKAGLLNHKNIYRVSDSHGVKHPLRYDHVLKRYLQTVTRLDLDLQTQPLPCIQIDLRSGELLTIEHIKNIQSNGIIARNILEYCKTLIPKGTQIIFENREKMDLFLDLFDKDKLARLSQSTAFEKKILERSLLIHREKIFLVDSSKVAVFAIMTCAAQAGWILRVNATDLSHLVKNNRLTFKSLIAKRTETVNNAFLKNVETMSKSTKRRL